MAIVEGLCSNCGSLIQVDTAKQEQRCIFCWAEVNADFSQSLLHDSSDYEFPNEDLPQPSGSERQAYMLDSMGQAQAAQALQRSRPQPRKKKEETIAPAEKVRLMTRPIVEPVASRKSRLYMLGGILAFVLVTAAIFTPFFLNRTARQEALVGRMNEIFPFPVSEDNVSLDYQNNRSLMVVSPESVDEETARTVYENFGREYADVYDITDEEALKRIEVEVLGPDGGYIINNAGSAVREDN